MQRKIVLSGLLILAIVFTITNFPSASAAEDKVIVRTDAELLTAIEREIPVIVIDGTIALSQEIEISHDLTIRGQGTLTVSDWHRHFTVSGGHLAIDGDIILTRAAGYEGHGGGVYVWRGIFTFYSGQIYGNLAYRGGGIHITQTGSVYIYGGIVRNNNALLGGGVYLGSAWRVSPPYLKLTMRNGLIENNIAELTGGGVFAHVGALNLEEGVVRNNRAIGHGGVYIDDFSLSYIGSGMQFYDNYPPNRHDLPAPLHIRLLTLSPIRILAVVALAIVGTIVTTLRNKCKQRGKGEE